MNNRKRLIATMLAIFPLLVNAQSGQNEFEKRRLEADLSGQSLSLSLVKSLNSNNDDAFTQIKTLVDPSLHQLTPVNGGSSADLDALNTTIYHAFNGIDEGENAAVVLVYRKFLISVGAGGGATTYSPDLSNVYTKVYHRAKKGGDLDAYLLSTRRVYVILIDIGETFYATAKDKTESKLSASAIKIDYKKSRLKQSAEALAKVWGMMANNNGPELRLTLIEVDASQVKAPCEILVANKSFKSDLKYTIHEKNTASFQVGVTNNHYTASNFSISGNNLVVKPSADQLTTWKSNACALFELHFPRDIDNFRPFWSTLFVKSKRDKARSFSMWAKENTLDRLGVYGGAKISKDPLSDLYAGLNFAITKDVAFNIGWAWSNEYQDQVTAIGEISSLNEALSYARRDYSKGKFSLGLSFSPVAVLSSWGLK